MPLVPNRQNGTVQCKLGHMILAMQRDEITKTNDEMRLSELFKMDEEEIDDMMEDIHALNENDSESEEDTGDNKWKNIHKAFDCSGQNIFQQL